MKPTYEELEVEVAFLKAEIAKLKYALTGRTMSCELCNNTARERDEIKEERDSYKTQRDNAIAELALISAFNVKHIKHIETLKNEVCGNVKKLHRIRTIRSNLTSQLKTVKGELREAVSLLSYSPKFPITDENDRLYFYKSYWEERLKLFNERNR